MPELPEVETIVRALREGGRGGMPIIGRIVRQVEVFWSRSIQFPTVEEFSSHLSGQKIHAIHRRGKFIIIDLEREALLLHLRMSGDVRVENDLLNNGENRPPEKHDRFILHFDNGTRFVFNDPRKFGRAWLVSETQEIVGKLGPEPLDENFDAELFNKKIVGRRKQLKSLLLDQNFLAGVGNIYSDEALFMAGLHPLRMSDTLLLEETGRLWAAVRKVLEEGISRNGASIDWVYRGGSFQNQFNVYGRTGKPCLCCGTPIAHITVGQRSTHFCPVCQPEHKAKEAK